MCNDWVGVTIAVKFNFALIWLLHLTVHNMKFDRVLIQLPDKHAEIVKKKTPDVPLKIDLRKCYIL